jgi:hypothetical protein
MILTFKTKMPIAETMAFEDVYEENLRLDAPYKAQIVRDGVAVWMFVDGELAGETYGISPARIDEEIEDLPERDPAVIYCYSTTLFPKFQKRNLSKILCAYWFGLVKGAGYCVVAGHTTSPAMRAVKASFGATFSAVHEGWYGTRRVAHFYRMTL